MLRMSIVTGEGRGRCSWAGAGVLSSFDLCNLRIVVGSFLLAKHYSDYDTQILLFIQSGIMCSLRHVRFSAIHHKLSE